MANPALILLYFISMTVFKIPPTFQWFVVLLVLGCMPHFAKAAENFDTQTYSGCLALLEGATIRPFKGFVLDVKEPRRAKLGQGIMGGVATRITDSKSGESWVEKEYFNSNFFQNDKWAAQLLKKVFAQTPHDAFKMAEIFEFDDDSSIMKLEWVSGETVQDKLKDWNNATQRQQQIALLNLYVEFLIYFSEAVDAFLASTDLKIVMRAKKVDRSKVFYSLEYEVEPGLVATVNLGVRNDNVIIRDQPRQLVLIDPY